MNTTCAELQAEVRAKSPLVAVTRTYDQWVAAGLLAQIAAGTRPAYPSSRITLVPDVTRRVT